MQDACPLISIEAETTVRGRVLLGLSDFDDFRLPARIRPVKLGTP